MKNRLKKTSIFAVAVIFVCSTFSFAICQAAFATDGTAKENDQSFSSSILSQVNDFIGSVISGSEEEELNDTETELDALGFDTSELPEGYDPDSGSNPKGTEYSTLQQYSELLFTGPEGHTPDPSGEGKRNNCILFGHDNPLNSSYFDFKNYDSMHEVKGLYTNVASANAGAGADFIGKGRKGQMAYVTIESEGKVSGGKEEYKLSLRFYDCKSEKSSDPIILEQGFTPFSDTMLQSFVQISAGDYDGDGLDEVAVLVPQDSDGDSGIKTGKIAIYKLKSDKVDYLDEASWKEVWSYTLPAVSEKKGDWNCVDIVSGDITKDGIDDMIVSWGMVGISSDNDTKIDVGKTVGSRSFMLFGDNTGKMLRNSIPIEYGMSNVCRVAFAIGDVDGDGNNDVVMGGQHIDDAANGNTSRVVGYYQFDEESQLMDLIGVQNMAVVDGYRDSDDKWVSNNNYDSEYLSQPVMKANVAITSMYGPADETCIYVDSVLYRYSNKIEIVDELDDSGKYKPADPRYPDDCEGPLFGRAYYEYNASGEYLAGPATQGLVLERIVDPKGTWQKYDSLMLYENTKNPEKGGPVTKERMIGSELNTDSYAPPEKFPSGGNFLTVVDTDTDSAVMRYTGNQSFSYSSPKVYAVLASAPYFEDVAENAEDGEDIKGYSSTAWGKKESFEESKGDSQQATIGWKLSAEFKLIWESALDVEAGYIRGRDNSKTESEEYSMTYSTVAGEDCVVFFSIPAAVYEYEVEYVERDRRGNDVRHKSKEYITIPYNPVSQTITLETYNEIQKTNKSLPDIDGEIIKSECGDPASYPSSSRGYNDAIEYKGDWSSPSYSTGGDVEQEIELSTSDSTSDTKGGYFNFSWAFGTENVKTGPSLTAQYTDIKGSAHSDGTSCSGTVYNMVPDAKGYGYNYAWKLMTYTHKCPNGDEIPVVTYLTRDVTSPPVLPDNFRQDFANTTDSQIALKWTYDNTKASSFSIYRHTEFPEGADDVLVGTVKSDDYTLKKNSSGELVYDEDGKSIKEYEFVDTGLAEYSDYEYRLQVNRSKAPAKSIPTKPVSCKTRALYQPEVGLSDNQLDVYYDTIKTVSANVKESDSFIFRNKTFQWQKYNEEDDSWADIPQATSPEYKFSKCSLKDAGDYRCRVNSEISVLTNTYRVTAYSDILTVNYSKRNVRFGDVTYEEHSDYTDFTIPVTNCGDGARTQPQGYILYYLDDGQEIQKIRAKIDPETNTAIARYENLPDGAYELITEYDGSSKIFKDAVNDTSFTYMKNISTGRWLSLKKQYRFNEDLLDSLKLFDLEANGTSSAKKTDVTDTITRVELVTADETESSYASFDLTETKEAVIPCLCNDKPIIDLKARVYAGDELIGEKDFEVLNGSLTLYIDDIEADAGSGAPKLGLGDIKIKEADGYEDGESPFREKISDYEFEAFADAESRYNIGVYTPSHDFLGYIDPTDEFDTDAVNISKLSPGEYQLRIEGGAGYCPEGTLTEEDFFSINYQNAKLILLGDTYRITAYGEKINGRDVGTVRLSAPEKMDEVKDVKFQGGTALTFKAIPENSYSVKYWIVNDHGEDTVIDNASDTLSYKVRGTVTDITVKAVFEVNKNRISAQTLGGGENSTVECTSDPIGANSIIAQGKALTFKAKAAEGYEFLEWRYVTVNGKTTIKSGTTTEDRSESTADFVMGDVSATVFAVFQRQSAALTLSEHLNAAYINTSEINASLADGVEVPVSKDMKIPKGATVIVRPDNGYKVTGEWSVSSIAPADIKIIEGGSAIRFTVPADAEKIDVTNECKAGIYGVSAGSNDNSADVYIKVNGEETTDFDSIEGGSTIEVTAKPHRGYVFRYWKINNKKVSNPSEVYTAIVTKNMDIEAVCEPVSGNVVKAGYKGSGAVRYEIETASGETVKGDIEASGTDIEVFNGESITFITEAADSWMPSYVIVDGEKIRYQENRYTISEINESHSITIGIEPAVLYNITVNNRTDYTVKTAGGDNVYDSISVGDRDSVELVILGVENDEIAVAINGEPIETIQKEPGTYCATIGEVTEDAEITIDKFRQYLIYDTEDFLEFRNALISRSRNISAILMADIEATQEMFSGSDIVYLNGTFNGNGHCISGLNMTDYPEEENAKLFSSLFGTIDPEGSVRNLTIRDCNIYGSVFGNSASLLCTRNSGSIDNCSFSDLNLHIKSKMMIDNEVSIAASSTGNGSFSNCLVKDVDIDADHAYAITGSNSGQIENCFVEGFTLRGSAVTSNICRKSGSVNNCWYDIGGTTSDTSSTSGNNIWNDGMKMLSGELAYKLNGNKADGHWGMCSNDEEAYPVPIKSGLKYNGIEPAAPLQIVFKGYRNIYLSPGTMTIPSEADTGVKIWTNGGACYGAGTKNVKITKNEIFTPAGDADVSYACCVKYSDGSMYFENFADAAEFAGKNTPSTLTVSADTNITKNVEIRKDVTVRVAPAAILTIDEDGALENNGIIDLKGGGTIVNYGSYQNNITGILDIGTEAGEGNFINNGKFRNDGTISRKSLIRCKNHSWGHEVIEKEATVSEEGLKTVTCDACGVTKEIVLEKKSEAEDLIISLNTASVTASKCTYTGSAITPALTVTAETGEKLVKNRDYKVKCTNNINVGYATATVTGMGVYQGTMQCKFEIIPKKTYVKSLSRLKRGLTVKWKKRTKQVTGYQIAYSTSKTFSSSKYKTIKKNTTVKTEIRKLKKNKRYYVKIRTYKTVKGVKHYSKWSKVKCIKTR